jgi:hypothetical protein
MITSAQDGGEHLELAAGAAQLAIQPPVGQAGFGHGAGHDRLAALFKRGGDAFEEGGAGFRGGFAEGIERRVGKAAGLVQVGGGGDRELTRQSRAGGSLDAVEAVSAGYPARADQIGTLH